MSMIISPTTTSTTVSAIGPFNTSKLTDIAGSEIVELFLLPRTVQDPFHVSTHLCIERMIKLSPGCMVVARFSVGIFDPGACARNQTPLADCQLTPIRAARRDALLSANLSIELSPGLHRKYNRGLLDNRLANDKFKSANRTLIVFFPKRCCYLDGK